MENNETKQNLLTTCLMIVYLLILTWIIVFKMQFSIQELDHFHDINLIPFHESVIVNNRIAFSEIYKNIIVFVPFGLYVSMVKRDWSFLKKVAPIVIVSLFYEVVQFIFKIGASDITDLIGTTLGGIIGIVIYLVLRRLFKTDFKTNKILNIIAFIGTICVVILLALLVLS
ncbi:VanZ family protein [Clostridium tagluense]|uniref:VanZ family protein n=1 Tax=Clostridium tagluense TaxID=360422 RepID=UPI001CF4EA56|nr:VanZ family protein [Clostridium tagluense]MCB2314266.1 VanZ family protein [Clostridium tagluense]MCB2318822.1 VanZ family protein [Clostridium tagluense]MCB2324014.1 VanZ family protein [Clostridium tagluense]MCB2328862.1 VanZ family protein [Clostridium tagluense]MCB2333713.1 VanZ family protein [Clostridium tagluense]